VVPANGLFSRVRRLALAAHADAIADKLYRRGPLLFPLPGQCSQELIYYGEAAGGRLHAHGNAVLEL